MFAKFLEGSFWFIIALASGMGLQGWLLVTYWEWFVTSVFEIHQITYVEALGLCCMLVFFNSIQEKLDDMSFNDFCKNQIWRSVLITPILLLVGYIIHSLS